ncbi:DHA2 family multidrug resistance protein-like MFS transporter [Kitasatospora sp. MAP12-15]|uniref:MFS transporter n=1 Tax=unclassified Kitasatospora TaxID=2633591 RepID=UPI002473DF4A|nr:MFS transporter [Kitasatospora sp. MAP12-44]MDH6115333.1 DHA2 family multidrug resistance protein-like MFS transporter [Kitasatospora sp. MAP12-44]
MASTAALNQPAVKDRWSLVAVAGMLSFVAMLDMNIVNLALPDLSRSFGISAGTAQWAALGYQLPLVALLLPAGRWLDQVGTRAALLFAVGGFALCSAAAAAAPWAAWLITARLAQGAFGAVLFVLMPVLAARSVRPELRGRAMSVPATLGPLGAVTGPALGGLLLDHLGWRAIFLVKLPVCVAALVIAYRDAPLGGGLRLPDRASLGDAGLVGGAVAALLLALTLSPGSPAWLLLAVVALPLTALWWRRPGARPISSALRDSGTYGVHGAVLALAAAFAAMRYVLALHLQQDDAVSATATGLTTLCFPLGMGLAGPLGGRLADRFGARRLAAIGATVTAVGLLLLVPLSTGRSLPDIAWRLALAGIGMGLYGGPVQSLVMTALPPDRIATGGSAVQLARSLGFTLGPALATAAWGLSGSGPGGVRAGLGLAAAAACSAALLLAFHGTATRRSPSAPRPKEPVS